MVYYAFSKLYPDKVDYNMNQLKSDFMKKYYKVELSSEEIVNMLSTKAPDGVALVK